MKLFGRNKPPKDSAGDTESAADGSPQEAAADGSPQEAAADGSLQEAAADGSLQEAAADGSFQEAAADGSLQEAAADGSPQHTAADGSFQEAAADGSPRHTAADGSLQEAAAEPRSQPEAVVEQSSEGFFSRLKQGLSRTGNQLASGVGQLFLGRKEIDAGLLEELETALLQADVGVEATMDIVGRLTEQVSRKDLKDGDALYAALQQELLDLLAPCEQPLLPASSGPFVILMVGVNGAGKTTTIGKLARRFQAEGKSVMLAAGDTFRAAAVEQLQVWGERNQVPVVAQHTGADSASVIFDALQAAQARGVDVLIADTAGRLHNKDNLMEELKKVVRVMGKLDASAPQEVMLVLDAGMGQNALAQAEHFQQAVGVSGIVLTKLDGTAKGGIIFAVARKLGLPIRFIGVGEAAEDLRPFRAQEFIDALFSDRA